MSTVAIDKAGPTRNVKYGSMSRDRAWALRWSYFFLVLFAIFSLTPPFYMLITSLKSSAEISAATNPWWVFHPTLENYIGLLTSNQFLRFFWNSAWVSIVVVTITMLISVPAAFALARMKFWGSATLATGVFLTYLIPDSLLFIPLFKMFAVIGDWTGIQLINRWYVLLFIYPTLTVPFCTWIMIGYFASIPKELDEAAIIDGASWFQTLTRIFIPVALPGLIRGALRIMKSTRPTSSTQSASVTDTPVTMSLSLASGVASAAAPIATAKPNERTAVRVKIRMRVM